MFTQYDNHCENIWAPAHEDLSILGGDVYGSSTRGYVPNIYPEMLEPFYSPKNLFEADFTEPQTKDIDYSVDTLLETPKCLNSFFYEDVESKSVNLLPSKNFTAEKEDEVESVTTELTVSKSIRKKSSKAKSVKSFNKAKGKKSKASRSKRIMEGKLRLTSLDEQDFNRMYPQLKSKRSQMGEDKEKLSNFPSIFNSQMCSSK